MRIEILVLAALAAFASAAPQWPYRDAVAPYYYGYPGKTPYIYASADEDDEREESSSLARQDLKVATSDGASTVVVEDDEKADGVRVVETGSVKPLKPVVQSASNNQQQQDQQQPAATSSQAQQPLSTDNANNAQTSASGQPLTVQQQSGQQPPAFPPARPAKPPQRPTDEDEEDEEDEESEEDDEDAEDEEDDGDDDDEDEEDEEDRRRNNIAQKEAPSSEEPVAQPVAVASEEPQAVVPVTSEGSDEAVQEEEQQPEKVQSQSALLNNKINKSKQSNVAPAAAAVPAVPAKNKNKAKPVATKVKPNSGAIEALVPGYVTDQGEVLVPVDTVTGSQPITIVPDPFSRPSRIVSGPRPIPQSAIPSAPSRQVPYWYRSSPAVNPLTDDAPPSLNGQTLFTQVPPPGSIFTFDDDDEDDDEDDSSAPGNRLRQDDGEDEEEEDEDEEEEDRKKQAQPPKKQPLASVPAVGNSNEDDEAEANAFVNSGKPVAGKKPPVGTAATGIKKPGGSGKPTDTAASNEDSEEDPQSEEDDIDSEEEEDEEDDFEGARAAQVAASPMNRGRNYVDEEFVSFPPSRSPALFAVVQGKFQGPPVGQRRGPQPQVFSVPNPENPNQRYVVRVTPSKNRPSPGSPLYYRPLESGSPNKRVVNVASFDVSVEDTRPSPSSYESEEEESVSVGRPTPNYPFIYKVQGSLQGLGGPGGPQSLAGLLGRPPRPSIAYYGAAFSSGGPPSRPPRPYGGYGLRPPYSAASSLYSSPYGPGGPPPSSFSFGPRRPSGPPVIVRKKPSGGGPIRPPKPHVYAVYNPAGPSSGHREPVDEEYYTFEVPEHNNKIVSGGPPKKRPTVHRKPTPVIHQKHAAEEEENSDEQAPGAAPLQQVQIIPQGTVRRRIRGGKQLKPKKNSKKDSSTTKKLASQDQQDPLGLLSKVNKSKTKSH